MPSTMGIINSVVSAATSDKHIFYFKSEDRGIIKRATSASSALKNRIKRTLGLKTSNEELVKEISKCLMPASSEYGEENRNLVYYITDFQILSSPANNSENAMYIKAFLDWQAVHPQNLLLISANQIIIPDGFSDEIELIELKPIDADEIAELLESRIEHGKYMEAAKLMVGLSSAQIESILSTIYNEYNGQYTAVIKENGDMPQLKELVRNARKKDFEKDHTLEFDEEKPKAKGMIEYTKWLDSVKDVFSNYEKAGIPYGISRPKGVLLTGLPGTGKTEMARLTRGKLQATLIRFHLEALQTSSFGGTESAMKRYLDIIDSVAPCILMIDEIEKSFQKDKGQSQMHEVKKQLLGQLLQWMQEQRKPVFCFFTSNHADDLPDELLRDGRLSERFFAFMPTVKELAEIISSEMNKRNEECEHALNGEKLYEAAAISEDNLRSLLNQIAEDAKKTGASIFMTGANAVKLIDMVNQALKKEGERKPYSKDSVKDALFSFFNGKSELTFIPYGQSNADKIAEMWVYAYKKHYRCVSESYLLDFDEFDQKTGKFEHLESKSNRTNEPYDDYFREVFKDQIEAVWRREKDLQKR